MFKKYFEWTLDNYRQMKIVNACKHSWQCAACGWVAKQKLERKQRKKKNKSFMKIKDFSNKSLNTQFYQNIM